MKAPDYTTIIIQLFGKLDDLTHTYVFQGYTAFAKMLIEPLTGAALIAIALFGIGMSMGWIEAKFNNFIRLIIRIGCILGFALSWGIFSAYAYDIFNEVGGDFGEILIKAAPFAIPHNEVGINGALQYAFNEFVRLTEVAWKNGHLMTGNIQPYFGALIIFFFGVGMVALALFELALAKIMMALLLAAAPLFIGFAMFPSTQSFFERWLGALIGFVLLPIFVSAMIAFALAINEWALGEAFLKKEFTIDGLNIYALTVLVGILSIFIIKEAANLAHSIGGVLSLWGTSSQAKNFIDKTSSLKNKLFERGKEHDRGKQTTSLDASSNLGKSKHQTIRNQILQGEQETKIE